MSTSFFLRLLTDMSNVDGFFEKEMEESLGGGG